MPVPRWRSSAAGSAGSSTSSARSCWLAFWVPAGLGLYALGWGAFRLLTLPATLGLNNGVQRYGSIARRRGGIGGRALLRKAWWITGIASTLLAIGMLLSVERWAARLSDSPQLVPILVAFSFAVPAAAWLRVGAAATRVSQDLRASVAIEDFGRPFLFAVFAAVLLWAGWGAFGAGLAATLSFVVAGAVAVYWARRWFPQRPAGDPADEDGVGTRELIAYSVPTAMAGTVTVAMTWLDRLLVGFYMNETAVGWYQVAAQASGLFAVVIGAFTAIFAPMIAGLLEGGDREQLQELYRTATKWAVLAVVPGAVLCLGFSDVAVDAVFGADFAPAALPLAILGLGQLASVATGAVGFLLMMGGRQNLWLALSLLAVAADVVLNMALIPRYGLPGASVATSISVALLFGAGLLAVRRSLKLWPWDRRFVAVAVVVLTAFAAALLFAQVNPLGSKATVLAVLLGTGLLTLAGWRALSFEEADDILVAKLLRRR